MVRRCSIGRCQLLLLDCLNTTTTYCIVIAITISFDVDVGIIVKSSLIRHNEITINRAVDCVSFYTEVLRLDHRLHAARVRLRREEILQQLFDSRNVAFLALPGYGHGDDTLTFRDALRTRFLLLPFIKGHALVVIVLFLFCNANIIYEVFIISLLLHIVKSGQSALWHHILIHSPKPLPTDVVEVLCVSHLDVGVERVLLSVVRRVRKEWRPQIVVGLKILGRDHLRLIVEHVTSRVELELNSILLQRCLVVLRLGKRLMMLL